MELTHYYNKIKSILGLGLSLAKAGFKIKNEGSYLGILWYLLEPLALLTVIILLGKIFLNNSIEKYPLYLLLGLIMFNFFRQATTYSTFSITKNSGFIKSLKINYESLIVSEVLVSIFSHFFEIIILIIFLFIFKVPVYRILFYPLIFLFYIIFTIGFCFALSTIGAHIKDFKNVWSVLMNVLWFATPIFYMIPDNEEILISKFNIIAQFIEVTRNLIIYNLNPSLFEIILIISASILAFSIGLSIFEKNKRNFAELV